VWIHTESLISIYSGGVDDPPPVSNTSLIHSGVQYQTIDLKLLFQLSFYPETLLKCSSQTQAATHFRLKKMAAEVRPKPGAIVIRILTVSCQKRSHKNEAHSAQFQVGGRRKPQKPPAAWMLRSSEKIPESGNYMEGIKWSSIQIHPR
jgi:hypothetical protein